ncbi:HNH endonuclease [Ancylomarina euxinus]|uniref:HNH endonuclease n=1 Tax=Ancylomarina euxinus TaxID=2283627 RepID=A0A425Y0Y0_9BACT|nr:HNH endonuclease [Ancylomarina euxinus]MCZ4693786.1 HNH endonuclease [Ancylomarina euxinus]MUP15134.1 HNH endonuclease [Ancylomarina euxinus]RRG21557.1 HNH endonuclease [Ancylomarina euxinus]
MRPVDKGNVPQEKGVDIIFKEYSRARRYLIDRIGEYCSYCERKLVANLAVEHVKPKATNPGLRLDWHNFLLGCTNCNSTKGDKPVVLNDFIWSDQDNSFEFFDYNSNGLVSVINTLSQADQVRVNATIALVGLDNPTPKKGTVRWQEASDRRQEHRIQALMESTKFASAYANCQDKTLYRDLLVSKVRDNGFWSIWMHAFSAYPEVQRVLILAFPGTNQAYFQNILNPGNN